MFCSRDVIMCENNDYSCIVSSRIFKERKVHVRLTLLSNICLAIFSCSNKMPQGFEGFAIFYMYLRNVTTYNDSSALLCPYHNGDFAFPGKTNDYKCFILSIRHITRQKSWF